MNDYKILEVTTSYREETLPNKSSEDTTSVVECWLVAHCLYEYGTNNEVGSVDNDIYLIGTKEYDSEGNFTLKLGSNELPDYEKVETDLKEIIEKRIQTEINETLYRAAIREVTGKAESTINRYFRDSQTGLDLV